MMIGYHQQKTEHVYDEGTTDIYAAAGTGCRYHIDKVNISHFTIGAPVLISMTDGTTVFIPTFYASDDNWMIWKIDFGPYGWVSELDAAITLVVTEPTGKFIASCVTYATVIGRKVMS